MRLTSRAFLLVAVALCFYLVAVVNSLQSFYYVLVWLAVGLLMACLGIALLSLTGTTCELRERRASGYGRGEAGSSEAPPLWEAAFGNAGSLHKTGLVLELRLTPLDENGRVASGTVPFAARFLIEALAAGVSLDAPLALDFLPRGVYLLASARLIGSDVLGLFHASKRVVLPEPSLRVVVAPPVLPFVARREFAHGGGGRGGTRARARTGAGDDLRGVRAYVPGDDWRHVHWATTARTGELAVREFERNGREAALVVWDGALATPSTRSALALVEAELCLVTSLLVAIDAGKTMVDVAVLGGQSEIAAANGGNGLLSPASLELLARARPTRTTTLSAALFAARDTTQEHFGQMFIVSSSPGSDLLECVSLCAGRGDAPTVVLCETALPSTPPRLAFNGRATRTPSSRPSLENQEQALRATGARVVRVSLLPGEASGAMLEHALLQILEAA